MPSNDRKSKTMLIPKPEELPEPELLTPVEVEVEMGTVLPFHVQIRLLSLTEARSIKGTRIVKEIEEPKPDNNQTETK